MAFTPLIKRLGCRRGAGQASVHWLFEPRRVWPHPAPRTPAPISAPRLLYTQRMNVFSDVEPTAVSRARLPSVRAGQDEGPVPPLRWREADGIGLDMVMKTGRAHEQVRGASGISPTRRARPDDTTPPVPGVRPASPPACRRHRGGGEFTDHPGHSGIAGFHRSTAEHRAQPIEQATPPVRPLTVPWPGWRRGEMTSRTLTSCGGRPHPGHVQSRVRSSQTSAFPGGDPC